jgi:glycosyltransferase involved in cell wall biosynthesis
MVPFEAFLAEKPVVTTTDSGGPLEVVHDRGTGLVVEPTAAALAEACTWLGQHVESAREWGQAGKRQAELLSWDHAIDRLLA